MMISAEETPLLELDFKNSNAPERGNSGAFALRYGQAREAELTDGFDFSSMLPTPLEITAIRRSARGWISDFLGTRYAGSA